jgi:ribosomal protein S18 acetylase RimI-like enzyme
MSVVREQRRLGIGRAILAALVEAAQQQSLERVVLETSADWHDAVRFYQRCGFTLTHHEEGPFGRDACFELDLARARPSGQAVDEK